MRAAVTGRSKAMIARVLAERVRLSTIVALGTFVLVAVRAWSTVDPYWDTLAYHWVFAARSVGLCGRECFAMPPLMEALYDGFPLFVHRVQGALWRLTGGPSAGDLVNVGAVVALLAYLRARFRVPLAWSWLAMLAIPVVQIELTSSYIDVTVNALVTIALLVVLRMLVEPAGDHRIDVVIALAALAAAVGGKFLMVPVALLAWAAITVLAARTPSMLRFARRGVALATLAVVGAIALLPALAINARAHGNPFYPIGVDIGRLHIAGPFPMRQPNAVSLAWMDSPQPLRWLASVGEYDSFRARPLPWTIGQGDVPHESPSFRMGGYFVGYVLGAVALLVWSARSVPGARWSAAMMILLSGLCAWSPASHELRYYAFWMMTLVCVVLAATHAPAFASTDQPARRRCAHALVVIATATVISMTGAAYLQTEHPTLEDLIVHTRATVAQVPDGGVLCIRDRSRFAFLYAEIFHRPRHYATRLLDGDEPDDRCTMRVSLPY